MLASPRNTAIASLLESFLDENKDYLSADMFRKLDDLAAEIDNSASKLHEQIDTLQQEDENYIKKIGGINNVIFQNE